MRLLRRLSQFYFSVSKWFDIIIARENRIELKIGKKKCILVQLKSMYVSIDGSWILFYFQNSAQNRDQNGRWHGLLRQSGRQVNKNQFYSIYSNGNFCAIVRIPQMEWMSGVIRNWNANRFLSTKWQTRGKAAFSRCAAYVLKESDKLNTYQLRLSMHLTQAVCVIMFDEDANGLRWKLFASDDIETKLTNHKCVHEYNEYSRKNIDRFLVCTSAVYLHLRLTNSTSKNQ